MILGPLTSGASLATAPLANRGRVVQVTTIAGTPQLSGAGDYVFRVFPSDEFQGRYIGDVGVDVFHPKSAAVVYVNNAYGVAVRDVVKTAYSRKGGKIVAEEAVEEGGTNFNSQIAKIKSANPDLVFGLLYYNEGAQFLVQAKQQGMSVPVLGGDAWFGPIGAVAGDAIDLLVFSSVAFGPDRKDSPRMREFIASFEATYGRKPDSYSATGYDAVQVARYAIEEVGASGEKIAKALRTLDFDGALGQVKFNENGDNVGGKFSLFKIRGDKAVPFSP